MVDVLLKRRSCRQFVRDEPVPKADIEKILAAGRAYACSFGRQGLEFVAITNRATLDRLGEGVSALSAGFKQYLDTRQARYGFQETVWCDAPLVIFANYTGPPDYHFAQVNNGAAVLNLIAVAEELGYGTLPVLMGSNEPQNAAVSEILGVPPKQLGLSVGIGKAKPSWKPDAKQSLTQVKWVD
jgi:nitroreductase